MAKRIIRSLLGGYGIHGWELDGRQILWTDNSERPTMVVPGIGGSQLSCTIPSRAFDVPLGRTAKRRPAMHRAALAFFAPLLEDGEGAEANESEVGA